MHFIDDTELLRQIKKADRQAFQCLFERYHKLMYLEAKSLLNNDEEAKDSVQEIFIWFWEKRENIDIAYSLRSYLVRAVRYNCANRIRSKVVEEKRMKYFTEGLEMPLQQQNKLENNELNKQLSAAINLVPPVSRAAFEKSYIEGKSLKEIAIEMGVSVFTVKNNLARAVKSLRSTLKNAH